MKYAIYFSGVLGVSLLVFYFIAFFSDYGYQNFFLFIGLGIFLFVTLPLYLVKRYRYRKKMQLIIKTQKKANVDQDKKKKKGVHDYPSFRKQKMGLTWGGGNIHAANAKRGSKRGFLNH